MLSEAAPCFFEVGGERHRGGLSERGVRSPGVIIIGPDADLFAGMGKAGEKRLAEQLVTHPPVKALDERVLRLLIGCRVD